VKPLSALVIYALFWTLTLFAVLPWGVRTSAEAGEDIVPGQADSAPVRPNLRAKALWTTLISAILFGLYYANYVNGWIGIDDIPGWGPR
jgi:predicted secreted protein